MAWLLNSSSAFCKIPCIYDRKDCSIVWHIRMMPLVNSIFQVLIAVCRTPSHRTDHIDLNSQHHMNFKPHLIQCSKVYYCSLSWASFALSIISPSALRTMKCSYLLLKLPCDGYFHMLLFLCWNSHVLVVTLILLLCNCLLEAIVLLAWWDRHFISTYQKQLVICWIE